MTSVTVGADTAPLGNTPGTVTSLRRDVLNSDVTHHSAEPALQKLCPLRGDRSGD